MISKKSLLNKENSFQSADSEKEEIKPSLQCIEQIEVIIPELICNEPVEKEGAGQVKLEPI